MGWSSEVKKHYCDFPYNTPPDDIKQYWTCEECGTSYRVNVTGWTGWWSPDTETDVVIKKHTIYCKWEEWVTCPPSITFTVEHKGDAWPTEYSSWSSHYPYVEKPVWITEAEMQPKRPFKG